MYVNFYFNAHQGIKKKNSCTEKILRMSASWIHFFI